MAQPLCSLSEASYSSDSLVRIPHLSECIGMFRDLPSVARYVRAIAAGAPPPREVEDVDRRTRAVERVMLGLRLDEPVGLLAGPESGREPVIHAGAVERLAAGGLLELVDGGIVLTRRGRLLGDAVTAELIL